MPKTTYACALCGEGFGEDYDECVKHEKEKHIKPLKYTDIESQYYGYVSYYPDALHITMEDGSVHQFGYEVLVSVPTQEKENPLASGKED